LQAAVAILATSPENAKAIQERHDCHLKFVAFDILKFRGTDTTIEPLRERLMTLEVAVLFAGSRDSTPVPLIERRPQTRLWK
jgi:ATP-dependent DNA ligase